MKLSERDRKVLVIGGAVAVLTVLVLHVGLPLARKWSDLGEQLEPRRESVARLRERIDEHEKLLDRRRVLVRRMGSLLDPVAPTGEGDVKPDEKPQEKAPEGEKGSTKPDEKALPEGTPKPADGEGKKAESSETPEKAADEKEVTTGDGKDSSGETPAKEEKAETSEKPGAEKPGDTSAEDNSKEKAGEKESEDKGAEANSVPLSTHVEQTAKAAGVKIQRLVPKKYSGRKSDGKYFKPVLLEVSVESDIKNLLKMIHGLEKGPRFARIEQLKVHRDLKQPTIKASLDVMAYEAAGD